MTNNLMRLKVLLPSEVLLNERASKVIAEAENGSFCVEPRHVDFVAALVPGLLSFVNAQGEEVFLATDSGVLVKCGAEVSVSVLNAVRGTVLEELHEIVERHLRQLDEQERIARSAVARLEAGVVRRFIELEKLF
ncbi:F0F1 ATP synthase subunit epsilon [Kaarinaea lacus]